MGLAPWLGLPLKLCDPSCLPLFVFVPGSMQAVVADENVQNVGKGKIVIPSSPSFRDFYHLCKIFRR